MSPRYLRPSLNMPDIYLYRAPVDFRMQALGLAVNNAPSLQLPQYRHGDIQVARGNA